MSDESNRENGEEEDFEPGNGEETDTSNQGDGDGADDASAAALAIHNKETGKNYKSWDDVKKREKDIDDFYARGGGKPEKKEEKPAPQVPPANQATDSVVKDLFFDANPEAREVWEEVERAAQALSRSPFELYKDSSYGFFKEKGKKALEAKEKREEAESKVGEPRRGGRPIKDIDFASLTDQEVADLPPEQYEKYAQWRKSQGTSGFRVGSKR